VYLKRPAKGWCLGLGGGSPWLWWIAIICRLTWPVDSRIRLRFTIQAAPAQVRYLCSGIACALCAPGGFAWRTRAWP